LFSILFNSEAYAHGLQVYVIAFNVAIGKLSQSYLLGFVLIRTETSAPIICSLLESLCSEQNGLSLDVLISMTNRSWKSSMMV
jgi:hypothetical protein